MGASGGHSDAAAGASLAIVVAPLLRARLPMVLKQVNTIVTPGESVDVVVTERGVAINPRRQDLRDHLKGSGVPVMEIEELRRLAVGLAGEPDPVQLSDEIVGLVEYRDGTIIDTIRRPL